MAEKKLLFMLDPARIRRTPAQLIADAESGDGMAACILGDMHRTASDGFRHSPAAARAWYARSALLGNASGQNNLGACHEHALGCRQSYARAAEWYRRASDQGLGVASMNLAYCYLHGRGLGRNLAMALSLFRKGLAEGETRCMAEIERLQPGDDAHSCQAAPATEEQPINTLD